MRTDLNCFLLAVLFGLSIPFSLTAQTGCPGCQTALPSLPEDTIFVSPMAEGTVGQMYSEDVSFRMPKTTDPVSVVDPSVPPGLTLNQIELISIDGVPPGLSWEANQTVFDPADETDGCFRFCGTPLDTGWFVMQVNIEATILVITQSSSFILPVYIGPATSSTDGFDLSNTFGCGSVTVSFTNNVPSNGNPGYSYFWDFGNGLNSSLENPPAQTYSTPGTYVVEYEATIDTSGYFLTEVEVLTTDCSDLLGNSPDLNFKVFDPDGNLYFTSVTYQNEDPPVSFSLNLPLDTGNYLLEIWDDDDGINGPDDLCGTFLINQQTTGPLVDGPLTVDLNIAHPVSTITSSDSIQVFAVPEPPVVNGASEFCTGDSIWLTSSYPMENQWFFNGAPVPAPLDDSLQIGQSGTYGLQYTSPDGCLSDISEVDIEVLAVPASPLFTQDGNLLSLLPSVLLPADFSLQWYLNGEPIGGANDTTWCMLDGGDYTLEVVDEQTGCSNTYSLNQLDYTPGDDCLITSIQSVEAVEWILFPNPFTDRIELRIDRPLAVLNVVDTWGRTLWEQRNVRAGSYSLNGLSWPSGVYVLMGRNERGEVILSEKLVKQ